MFRNAMVAALVWLAVIGTASAQEVQTPERAIPDRYIVVLNDDQVGILDVRSTAEALARQHGGRVMHVYEHALRGFTVAMSATRAAALARNPRVRYVEQDSVMFIVDTYPNATWGLDRIDQRDLRLSNTYTDELAKQVARRYAHALTQPAGISLGRKFQPDIDQRSQSRVGGSQVPGLLREFVGQQSKVLATEFGRERRGV
jgi:hypothetical protein